MPNARELELWRLVNNAFNNSIEKFGDIFAKDVTRDLLAHGVTVQEWISVTERLPDTAERVLVSETWLGTVRNPQYGYFQKYPNQEGCWYILTDHGYYPRTSTEITHWMPLPQPPKGK